MVEESKTLFCIEQVQLLLVDFFTDSTTRSRVMRGFRSLVRELEGAGITADLRLQGSFVTEELNPDCLDVEVIVSQDFYDSCSKDQLALLHWIRDDNTISQTHLCSCQFRIGQGGRTGRSRDEFVIHVEPDELYLTRDSTGWRLGAGMPPESGTG